MTKLRINCLRKSKTDIDISKLKLVKGGYDSSSYRVGTLDSTSSFILNRSIPSTPSSLDYDYLGGTTPLFNSRSNFGLGSPGFFD